MKHTTPSILSKLQLIHCVYFMHCSLPRSTSLPLPSIPENQASVYSEVNVYEDAPDIEAKGGEGALYENPSVMSD